MADEDDISGHFWTGRNDLQDLTVYPEHLKSGFWDNLDWGFLVLQYLEVVDVEEDWK